MTENGGDGQAPQYNAAKTRALQAAPAHFLGIIVR